MTDDIKAIRDALAAGPTPGPWEQRTFYDHDGPPSCDDIQVCADAPCGECNGPLLTMDWRDKPKQCDFPREHAERTAAYIAAVHPERIARLLDALEAATKDAERLNWLDENPDAIRRSTGYLGSASSWTVRDADGVAHDFISARAAIDAAMQKEAP